MIIQYLWSPSARGFFIRGISSAIPEDSMPVSSRRHGALMEANAAGAAIEACPKTGKPLVRLSVRDSADLRAALIGQIKREARRRIEAISPAWRQLNDMRAPGDAATRRFAAIDAIREASQHIEDMLACADHAALETFPVSLHPLWPSFEDAA